MQFNIWTDVASVVHVAHIPLPWGWYFLIPLQSLFLRHALLHLKVLKSPRVHRHQAPAHILHTSDYLITHLVDFHLWDHLLLFFIAVSQGWMKIEWHSSSALYPLGKLSWVKTDHPPLASHIQAEPIPVLSGLCKALPLSLSKEVTLHWYWPHPLDVGQIKLSR